MSKLTDKDIAIVDALEKELWEMVARHAQSNFDLVGTLDTYVDRVAEIRAKYPNWKQEVEAENTGSDYHHEYWLNQDIFISTMAQYFVGQALDDICFNTDYLIVKRDTK